MEVNDPPSATDEREQIERLAEEFVERRRLGEEPRIEDYAARHPELAVEIRELFATLLIVEDLGGASGDGALEPAVAPGPSAQGAGLQQVGEYRILREIGRGGMGVVYEAEQASLGRRVALKVLPFHSLLDSKRLERFQQEARAAARLSHPNIVPVYGVGEHLGMHYYVMQFIPGQGLNRVIDEVRRLRESGELGSRSLGTDSDLAAGLESGTTRGAKDGYFRNVARLARDAALALDYAHSEGILHRDVKPSNLLLDPSGRVWLTDFGLAKAEGNDELTRSGDLVGTLLYMAPERFNGWSDPRSDVYGLGITLHELLTLRPAYTERDRAQLLRRSATEEPPAPRRIDRSIPRDLETVVLKATAREPAQRYSSARAMAQDLQRFLEGQPVEARRSHALSRLWRWCARNPLAAGLVWVVLALLVAVATISSTAAVRLAREQADGRETLRAAHLATASALRTSALAGSRFDGLEALRHAADIRPGPDLVKEAIASFAQPDLRLRKTWSKSPEEVFNLSPDGSTLAVAKPGGDIRIRSTDDDRELFHLPGPGYRAAFTWTKFSPDGSKLAARHELGQRIEWRIWDLDRRLVCARVEDAFNDNCVDFSPDGRWAVVAIRDGALRRVDLTSGRDLAGIGREWQVRNVAVHPAGRLIAFCSRSTRKVHLHDLETGCTIRSLSGIGSQEFAQVAWHPDGRTLAGACGDHLVYLWNAETGERTRTLQGHSAEVVGVWFAAGGSILASAGWDPAVRFWVPGSDRPVFSLQGREASFDFIGGSRCWSVVVDQAELWDLTSARPAFTLFGHERIAADGKPAKHPHSIALAAGGQLAATAGDDGVRLWDLAARRELARLGDSRVHSVLFDASGTALYTSGPSGIHRWSLRTIGASGARIAVGPVERLTQLEGWSRAAVARDGARIAAIHQKRHAHVFEPHRPERGLQLTGLPADWTIALSPGGEWAAAGNWGREHGREVLVWDLRDNFSNDGAHEDAPRAPVLRLPAPRAEVQFHPGGGYLATCTPRECTLWRLPGGKMAWRIEREGASRFPGVIAFDRDGRLAALSYDHSCIWLVDAQSGRKLAEFEASEPIRVTGLALEGGVLAACTAGRRFHVWDLNGLSRDLATLGLGWELSPSGDALANRPALALALVEASTDLLLDESGDLGARQLFRRLQSVAFLPRLSSCEDIDRALKTPVMLVAQGATWRYFRGHTEPSPELEWVAADADDRSWRTGAPPFTGRTRQDTSEGTYLDDQLGTYTTFYARCAFEVPNPAAITRAVLAVEIEDGFIAYLNGEEIGRVNAGHRGERLPCTGLARRRDQRRTTEVAEIRPELLRSGRNVLAVQALAYGLDSKIYVHPVLVGVSTPDAERDRERTRNLLADTAGRVDSALLAYRDARILQRAGRLQEALALFERAGELDPGAAEPLLRRLACLRDVGELARAEKVAREAIEGGQILEGDRLWRAWHHVVLVDARRPVAEVLAALPREPRHAPSGPSVDHRWILEAVAARGVIRIDCGGEGVASDGGRWSRDRFFLGGEPLDRGTTWGCRAGTPDGGAPGVAQSDPAGTERSFPGSGSFRRGYLIPLPPGRYRVTLHFVEWSHDLPGRRIFDVLLEGRTVLESCSPLRFAFATPAPAFDVAVTDGFLDLDFIAHRDQPRIAGIEVEAIPGEIGRAER